MMIFNNSGTFKTNLIRWTARFLIPSAAIFFLSPWMSKPLASYGAEPELKQMVEIAATIYEFRLESEKQLGIFYEYNRTTGSVQDSEIFLPGTSSEKETAIRALDLSGSFAELSYGSIDFNIKMAVEDGRATVINNPRSLVNDGQYSSLVSGEEVPLTVLQTIAGSQTKLALKYEKTGIKLNCTPYILPGNNVLLDLEIESSEILRLDVFDRGDNLRFELPVISTRNVKTTVVIPSKKMLYIGGLYTNNSSEVLRKVPILGDLPFIGFFLRGFNKNITRTETVFQITPTIKMPGEGISTDGSIFRDLFDDDKPIKTLNSASSAFAPIPADGKIKESTVSVKNAVKPNQAAPASVKSATNAKSKNAADIQKLIQQKLKENNKKNKRRPHKGAGYRGTE